MDPEINLEKQQEVFEEKYESKLGVSYGDWSQSAPNTTDEAFAYCQEIDDELKNTYEQWFNATGNERDELESYRQRLKLEYDIVEELFGLELDDK